MKRPEDINCMFYGYNMYLSQMRSAPPFLLIGQDGNQCAFVIDAFTPCLMDAELRPVDWKQCPRLKEARIGGRSSTE